MKQAKKGKVAVAMSGGVDSGAAVALVVKAGYQAAGFHMRLWQEDISQRSDLAPPEGGTKQRRNFGTSFRRSDLFWRGQFVNKCCDLESLEAARKTAHQLGISFYVIDLKKIFKKRVVDYFLEAYGAGLTPNPCVRCNKFIKFGELLKYVRRLGYDYLATGHYSRIATEFKNEKLKIKNDNSKFKIYHLIPGIDKTKDQSYFLYNLTQKQLAHVMFPVGEYLKKDVVAMARKWKLPVAKRPESQEICFFPESDYRLFLKRQIPGEIIPGDVVDTQGRAIGKHKGLPLYTIGQRHGFEIQPPKAEKKLSAKSYQLKAIPPFYVVEKDAQKNRLIVGFGKETERKEFWVREVNWVNPNFQFSIFNFQLFVRIRHGGELIKCRIENVKGKNKTPPRLAKPSSDGGENKKRPKVSKAFHLRGGIRVVLEEPKRGIAPGQAAVFYRKIKYQKLKRNRSKKRLITNHYSLFTDFEVLGGGTIGNYAGKTEHAR